MMRRAGTRLIKQYTPKSPQGFAYYIVPGGYIEPETAKRIIDHPAVISGKDGLFPGRDQTWRLNLGEGGAAGSG